VYHEDREETRATKRLFPERIVVKHAPVERRHGARPPPDRSLREVPGAPKLTERIVDMADAAALEQHTASLAPGHNAAFCTMGIGQPSRAPKEEFWRVDVELAGAFARGCGRRRRRTSRCVLGRRERGVAHLLPEGERARRGRVHGARLSARQPLQAELLVTREIRYEIKGRITQAVFPGSRRCCRRRSTRSPSTISAARCASTPSAPQIAPSKFSSTGSSRRCWLDVAFSELRSKRSRSLPVPL
jgi:hypothetical protein